MTHIALKDFPLSRDGVKIEQIFAGNPVDVPEGAVKGLEDEGFIMLPDENPAHTTPPAGSEGAGEKSDASEASTTKKRASAKKDGAE